MDETADTYQRMILGAYTDAQSIGIPLSDAYVTEYVAWLREHCHRHYDTLRYLDSRGLLEDTD